VPNAAFPIGARDSEACFFGAFFGFSDDEAFPVGCPAATSLALALFFEPLSPVPVFTAGVTICTAGVLRDPFGMLMTALASSPSSSALFCRSSSNPTGSKDGMATAFAFPLASVAAVGVVPDGPGGRNAEVDGITEADVAEVEDDKVSAGD
jgi:hypothetical protein